MLQVEVRVHDARKLGPIGPAVGPVMVGSGYTPVEQTGVRFSVPPRKIDLPVAADQPKPADAGAPRPLKKTAADRVLGPLPNPKPADTAAANVADDAPNLTDVTIPASGERDTSPATPGRNGRTGRLLRLVTAADSARDGTEPTDSAALASGDEDGTSETSGKSGRTGRVARRLAAAGAASLLLAACKTPYVAPVTGGGIPMPQAGSQAKDCQAQGVVCKLITVLKDGAHQGFYCVIYQGGLLGVRRQLKDGSAGEELRLAKTVIAVQKCEDQINPPASPSPSTVEGTSGKGLANAFPVGGVQSATFVGPSEVDFPGASLANVGGGDWQIRDTGAEVRLNGRGRGRLRFSTGKETEVCDFRINFKKQQGTVKCVA